MILTYHNVSLYKKNELTVDIYHFILQMISLLKYNVVNLKNYDLDNQFHRVITFDDGYKDILYYAVPILKIFHYPFEVFINSDFVFSKSEQNKYLNVSDLKKIVAMGGRLQYHSKSHPRLDQILNEDILEQEIICPSEIKKLDINGFDFFSYPYWRYNEKILNFVKKYYKGARSGNGYANNTIWAMDSIKILNNQNLFWQKT